MLLRVEHLSQPSSGNSPKTVNLPLTDLIGEFRAVSAHEFYAGGDMPKELFAILPIGDIK